MAIKHIKIGSTTHDVNDSRNVVIGNGVNNIVKCTLAEYNAITTKDSATAYYITDAPSSSGGGGSGEANVIETVKVNGTALTPDANKAVNVPVPIEHITVSIAAISALQNETFTGLYSTIATSLTAGNFPVLHLNDTEYDYIFTVTDYSLEVDFEITLHCVHSQANEIIYIVLYSDDTSSIGYYDYSRVGLQTTANKVTTLTSSSTDTKYPSAKCVYDRIAVIDCGETQTDIESLTGQDFYFSGLYDKIDALVSNGFSPVIRLGTDNGALVCDFKYIAKTDTTGYTFKLDDGRNFANFEVDDGDVCSYNYLSRTNLSKGTTSGNGNAVTDISVSGSTITLTKGSTFLTSETSLSLGTTSGNGNAVTDLSVSGHQITMTKGNTFLTSETDPVFTASAAHGISSSDITAWNAKQKAITVSSSEPTSSDGSNGDIWIVI